MIIPTDWQRIAGVHIQEDGQLAAVWLARDPASDRCYLYDCLVQAREVLAVRAAAMKARGKGVPVAWYKGAEEIAQRLLDEHDIAMLPEPVSDSEATAEMLALDLLERMRTKRFQVDRAQKAWADEYQTFQRRDRKVPRDSHPLMAATRAAIAMLDFATSDDTRRGGRINAPKLSIV